MAFLPAAARELRKRGQLVSSQNTDVTKCRLSILFEVTWVITWQDVEL